MTHTLRLWLNTLKKMICTKPTRSIEVNTDQSRIHTVDKGTQTEPLIILTPDELVSFSDGITIASFTNNIRIFVDTVNSTIVMSRPNLSTSPEPETQIGLLKFSLVPQKGFKPNHQFPLKITNLRICLQENPQDQAWLFRSVRGIPLLCLNHSNATHRRKQTLWISVNRQ